MEYTLSSYTYQLNTIQEYCISLLAENGNVYTYNIFDYGYTGSGLDYIAEKNDIDNMIPVIRNATSVNEGLCYGYIYYPYDSSPYLCLDSSECTYFACAYTGSSSFNISGYVAPSGSVTGYLKQRKGILDNYTFSGSTFVPTISYDDISLVDTDGLFFDYALSNNMGYHDTSPTSAMRFYDSCFQFDTNNLNYNNVYFRFGENEDTYKDYYNNGWNNGYEHGKAEGFDNGKTEGYAQGYTKGLTEGGNAPVGFMSMVGGAISQFTPVLNIEVLPNITLGTCISLPVIVSVIVIIFNIARG